jgi:hypothetical protein
MGWSSSVGSVTGWSLTTDVIFPVSEGLFLFATTTYLTGAGGTADEVWSYQYLQSTKQILHLAKYKPNFETLVLLLWEVVYPSSKSQTR